MNIKAIKRLAKKEGVGYHQEGKNPKIIIIGEEHTERYLPFQEKIIELIKPKIILHESAKRELLKANFPRNPNIKTYVKRILSWREKYKIIVNSPDINKLKQKVLSERISILLKEFRISYKKKTTTETKTKQLISYLIREQIMVKNIKKHLKEKGSPILVIVGSAHINPYRVLSKALINEEKIDFISLNQSKGTQEHLESFSNYFQ